MLSVIHVNGPLSQILIPSDRTNALPFSLDPRMRSNSLLPHFQKVTVGFIQRNSCCWTPQRFHQVITIHCVKQTSKTKGQVLVN